MENYSEMIPLNGTAIIKTKQLSQDRTESGLYKDTTFDVHGKMMICAEVVAIAEKGSNEVMFELDQGFPRSKEVERVYIRNKDVDHRIGRGDMVYFHYLTLEDPLNFIEYEHEWYYFKVPIHDIFLSIDETADGEYIKEGKNYSTRMHNEYVLGKEYWGEGWKSFTMTNPMSKQDQVVAGRENSLGIITEIKNDPEKDRATIACIGEGVAPYSRKNEIKAGDVVILKPNCEFENEIHNSKRWVFTHSDIVAKIIDEKTVVPVAEYFLVKVEREEKVESSIIQLDRPLVLKNEGTLISCGLSGNKRLLGERVKFDSNGAISVLDNEYAIVREGKIHSVLPKCPTKKV